MKKEDLFNIIDGIDDDIILDIPILKAEKPEKIVIQKRAPVWNYVSIAACFVCVLAVGIFAVTKIHGNISTSVPVTPSDITESGATSSISVNSEPGQTSEPEKTGPYYDDVFKEFDHYYDNPAVGMPMDYDDITEFIAPYLDSFYLVETIRALSKEETQALKGWSDSFSMYTVYEVRLLEDLISGEKLDRVEKIMVAHSIPERQTPRDPSYAPGERFTVTIGKSSEDRDYRQCPSCSDFQYDVVEDESGITLYSRINPRFERSEIDALNLPGSENIDENVITSTTQNPAVYTQKIGLDDLVSFLRSDWEQKGISRHFEKTPSENSSAETSQPVEPNTYYDTEIAEYSKVKELIKFADVPAPSDDEQNGIHGYEIGYIMPQKTPFEVMCKFTYGAVYIRDNSIMTIAPSSDLYKRIEYKGRVFWRDLTDDLSVTIDYISEDNSVSYTAQFMDETYAIEKIISLL